MMLLVYKKKKNSIKNKYCKWQSMMLWTSTLYIPFNSSSFLTDHSHDLKTTIYVTSPFLNKKSKHKRAY